MRKSMKGLVVFLIIFMQCDILVAKPLLPRTTRELIIRDATLFSLSSAAAIFSSVTGAQAKVRGYQAAQSIFSPNFSPPLIPRLSQSVLLNTLPIENELVGELQAYLESFSQLIEPSKQQVVQISQKNSALWNNLRINAQRAAGMFLYNRDDLLPSIASEDTRAEKNKRRAYGERYLAQLKNNVLKLVSASLVADTPECVLLMKQALTSLANVAYLLVPEEVLYADVRVAEPAMLEKYIKVPRLVGRATVELVFQRPGPLSILRDDSKQPKDEAKVTVIVDGINYPYTAGNFVSLCQNKFYDDTKVETDDYETNAQVIPRLVFGSPDTGYVDPLTVEERTIPLEVLRADKGKRFIVTGNAQNTLVFTRAKPVKSFATEGTLGMYHMRGDGNGASSAFFLVPPDRNLSPTARSEQPAIARLNTRFAAFAHVVEGGEVLMKLRPSDVLLSATVQDGAWELLTQKSANGLF